MVKKRFKNSWLTCYKARTYKVVDEEAVRKLVHEFEVHGQVYSVMRYITPETLRMAVQSMLIKLDDEFNYVINTRAAGTDGITTKRFYNNKNKYISDILTRLRGKYILQPMLRISIPKHSGSKETRPLSIPSIEDSTLELAIVNQILTPIAEQIFVYESFGFRPNRSVKDAIDYIEYLVRWNNINYALVLDNKAYFDSINRNKLLDMVNVLIKDKRFTGLLRTIINTGYMELDDNGVLGEVKVDDKGISQGANLSPVLANLYLHNVIDVWYKEINTTNEIYMVRYADDIVILGSNQVDMIIALHSIRERFAQYGLEIANKKTKRINLNKEDLTFLGYRLHKEDKELVRYISDKKIIEIKFRINSVVESAMTDIYDSKVLELIKSRQMYGNYLRDYIREINDLLVGIYRTYTQLGSSSAFDELYGYAINEVKKQWAASLSKSELEIMVSAIISPLDYNIKILNRKRR